MPQFLAVDFKAGGTYDNGTYRAIETRFAGRAVWVPYWLPTGLALVGPVAWLRAARLRLGRERQRLNLCVRCGYDLRATPGRCPECGTVAAPAGA